MIVFEPLGGLGNQLFSYAAGLAVATRLGVELRADVRNFRDYEWHNYELDSFANSIQGVVAANDEDRPRPRWKNLQPWRERDLPTESLFVEESSRFDKKFLEVPDGSRLRGYFQSWKYFSSVSGVIEEQLSSPRNPSSWFLDKRAELLERPPWIALHVRLGNYVGLEAMGVVADVYYRRALALLGDLGHSHDVLVFTDSPELLDSKTLFGNRQGWEVFPKNESSTPLENLLLMALAHHLVMGNSTFSWWAGWLGRRIPTRRVIYPRPWIDLASWDDRDLHLPSWLGMSREVDTQFERHL